ncbi:MAG: hypothetical protein IT364_12830 [Candidatus Hydrogenedentes bacterium]|nr:hypothetical protein [Candidatus Hydrogenedentota bacterium]
MLRQKHWRVAGGACLAACAVMAVLGVRLEALRSSPGLFLGYWALFLLLFVFTLYCVLLDIRFIKAEHAIMSREVFRETLGDEEFRKALREAQQKSANSAKPGGHDH